MKPSEELREEINQNDWIEVDLERFGRFINRITVTRFGEWCGTPIPIPGGGLVVEDRHPHAARIRELQAMVDAAELEADRRDGLIEKTSTAADELAAGGWSIVNQWHGPLFRGHYGLVCLYRHADGRTSCRVLPDALERNEMLLDSFSAVRAWDLGAELAAMERLRGLVTADVFKSYITAGGFFEYASALTMTAGRFFEAV